MNAPAKPALDGEPLLRVQDLAMHFQVPSKGGPWKPPATVRAVDGVSLELHAGETLGLVGESGCGKSTLARALVRLLAPTSGHVYFDGLDIARLPERQLGRVRGDIQMIFQDPSSSLNPRMTMANLLAEPLRIAGWKPDRIKRRISELIALVGLNETQLGRYPHEFSGGQKQRIVIARALALSPRVVICDEPVSALDVSVQAQIINLLKDLQDTLDVSYLFVAHDLGVVRQISHRVAVMYLGRIAEHADKATLFSRPRHPYTQALLSAIPRPRPTAGQQRILLEGDLPSPMAPPSGCRFRTRCPIAAPQCAQAEPVLQEVADGHFVACHRVQDSRRLMQELIENGKHA
jgi:oligopeptide/dipeptide ABC transporter ATP-binding protein